MTGSRQKKIHHPSEFDPWAKTCTSKKQQQQQSKAAEEESSSSSLSSSSESSQEAAGRERREALARIEKKRAEEIRKNSRGDFVYDRSAEDSSTKRKADQPHWPQNDAIDADVAKEISNETDDDAAEEELRRSSRDAKRPKKYSEEPAVPAAAYVAEKNAMGPFFCSACRQQKSKKDFAPDRGTCKACTEKRHSKKH